MIVYTVDNYGLRCDQQTEHQFQQQFVRMEQRQDNPRTVYVPKKII